MLQYYQTPLHYAVEKGSLSAVDALIKYKARLDITDGVSIIVVVGVVIIGIIQGVGELGVSFCPVMTHSFLSIATFVVLIFHICYVTTCFFISYHLLGHIS